MTEQNLLKLAKKGNAKALTAILNQSLQPKSVTAKVNRKDDYLQILLESAQTPDQEAMVSFIRKGLIKLEIESIQTVKVYGRKTGEESPAWSKKFELVSPPETPSSTEPIDSENLSSYQTFRTPKSSVTPNVDDPPSTRQTDFQNPRRSSGKSMNPSPTQPMGPVSVGNVISAAVRIYRDHFKLYYGLAFSGYLWGIVPIYGWAKSSAISALLSRLAYSEVIERPETVNEARSYVMPRMWSFLWAGILVGLIYFGIALGAMIVFAIVGGVIAAIVGESSTTIFVFVVLGLVFLFGCSCLVLRLSIVDLSLAIENNVDATSAISRSWNLTKGFVLQLIVIGFVAFLIAIPIYIAVQIINILVQGFVGTLVPPDSPTFFLLSYLLVLPLSFASGSLLIPFWQAIKAVVYYDLRTRKEGLGLEIRDSR
jgi:hypothetical protein